MSRVLYAPEAEADVYGIARHIAEEAGLHAGYRFIDDIDAAAQRAHFGDRDQRFRSIVISRFGRS